MPAVLENITTNLEKDIKKDRDIFAVRRAFKPFEYPEVTKFKDAMNHSYWLVSEWNFKSDIHDFKVKLNPVEQSIIKNTLLAISQIEVSVKKFWTKLGDRFPKSEFEQVGVTFGESEVRHADAYSHLLQVLGLNNDFDNLLEVPAINERVKYLSNSMKNSNDCTNREYSLCLTLFSIFIENVSLFSQFLIIKSFNKYKNYLKDIDNVVQSTQKEEHLHSLFGIYLINLIKDENPDWFNEDFYHKISLSCLESYKAEAKIIDWIFEQGQMDFLSSYKVKEFIKNRYNQSLKQIGASEVFNVNKDIVKSLKWFDDEILAEVNTDFFHKRPVNYSRNMQPINGDDLF